MHDLEPALYIKAYTEFAEKRSADQSCALAFLDYDQYAFRPPRPLGIQSFYCRAAEDCAREIINEIHGLRSFVQEARIWEAILKGYKEREQFLLTMEFMQVPFIHAMSRPYAVKNRFIYSLSMLGTMYKARKGSVNDFKTFEKCNYTSMRPIVGHWPGFADFTAELEKLNSDIFRQHSGEFRDSDHHRLPACVDVGLAPASRVWSDGGRVYFSNAVQKPIKIVDQLPALEMQYQCACRCMDRFWGMVQMREANW